MFVKFKNTGDNKFKYYKGAPFVNYNSSIKTQLITNYYFHLKNWTP